MSKRSKAMHIGFTYDLRSEYIALGYGEEESAEFDSEVTVNSIATALEQAGHRVTRIGRLESLVARLAAGERWDLVFNICEGAHGLGREAQVPALLDGFGIPYTFSDPLVLALSLHKGHTKTIVERSGVPTPRFALVERFADLERLRDSAPEFPCFAKPVAEGTGKGVSARSRVETIDELLAISAELLERFRQPVLVEEYLPGRELTVGIVGTGSAARVIGTQEILLREEAEPGVYSYTNKERSEELVDYRFYAGDGDREVRRAEEIALRAWRALGCRDAGRIDLRSDRHGEPAFLEVNPLAGLHPTHSDLPMIARAAGIEHEELIRLIVESASERIAPRIGGHDARVLPGAQGRRASAG